MVNGNGGEIMEEKILKETKLLDTVKGLDLTEKEIQTLKWLAQWERDTVLNICSIIHKAKNFGREI